MIKKITIAGIEIDDNSITDEILHLDRELENQSLFVIEEITMNMLLIAAQNEEAKKAIDLAALTVIGETGVLETAGPISVQRKREIENHEFFYQFMGRMSRGHKRVFLLGEKVEETDRFYQFLQEEFPRVEIVGVAATEENSGDADIINEINALTADAVLCTISYPARADFFMKNKDMIFASFWYGMEPDKIVRGRNPILHWLRKCVHRRKLAAHDSRSREESGQ